MKEVYYHHSPEQRTQKKQPKRITVVGLITEDNQMRFGIAKCSKKDQFTKKRGREIALGRCTKKPEKIIELKDYKIEPFGRQFIKEAILLTGENSEEAQLIAKREQAVLTRSYKEAAKINDQIKSLKK